MAARARSGAKAVPASSSRTINMGVIENSVAVSSLLLWVPYALMAIFVAYCSSFYYEVETDGASRASVPVRSLTSSVMAVLGRARLSHSYSQFYYYIFPEGFDITTFIPLVLRVSVYSAGSIFATFILAVHVENSAEILMALAWLIGVLSESMWMTSSQSNLALGESDAASFMNVSLTESGVNSSTLSHNSSSRATTAPVSTASPSFVSSSSSSSSLLVNAASHLFVYDSRVPHPSPWLWLFVSILTGALSGIFCKAKDVRDGKVSRDARQLLLSADQSGGMFSRTGVVAVSDLDVHRRRHRRTDQLIGLADRMYMVVPFWSGQWTSFILKHGWRGIIVENGVIVLTLGVIGYAMLSYRILQRQIARTATGVVRLRRVPRNQIVPSPFRNPSEKKAAPSQAVSPPATAGAAAPDDDEENQGGAAESNGEDAEEDLVVVEEESSGVDLMELVSKLFTTSFGAVVLIVLAVNIFISSLVIPFLKTLFSLNALVSSVGIIVEIIVYEIV